MSQGSRICGKRLHAAARYVRPGAVFADIGTDHAALPILLASSGRIRRAYACDVAPGPVAAARQNIAAAGLSDSIETRRGDGFAGLDGLGITDAAVCGMGGELIASLITGPEAQFLRWDRVRLVLQPMSRAAELRAVLAKEGFLCLDECLICETGRLYELICAEYTGEQSNPTALELQLGTANLRRAAPELILLCRRRIYHLTNLLAGQTGATREETLNLLDALRRTEEETEKKNDSKRTV